MKHKAITLGITGASGAQYGLTLLKELRKAYNQVYVLISDAARVVFATELNINLPSNNNKTEEILTSLTEGKKAELGEIILCSSMNWMSPVASGSAAPKQMIVCPCSTGTLSAIATGASNNLLERAADVVLKERGQLILLPRETPFSTLHLQNMTRLSEMGVTIMPLAPGFYHQPQSIDDLIDFMVARILDHLNIEHQLSNRWGYKSK